MRRIAIFPNQQVFTLRRDAAQSLFGIRPELNVFRGYHKVPLTLKIHSSGFIRWSEVARAPKTNRGLRSGGCLEGISNGQVPRTHHAGLVLKAVL